jgi:hypothetical protein
LTSKGTKYAKKEISLQKVTKEKDIVDGMMKANINAITILPQPAAKLPIDSPVGDDVRSLWNLLFPIHTPVGTDVRRLSPVRSSTLVAADVSLRSLFLISGLCNLTSGHALCPLSSALPVGTDVRILTTKYERSLETDVRCPELSL